MTISTDSTSDGGAAATVPALLPALATAPPSDPDAVAAPRTWRAHLSDYSAHAAMVVGIIGFAWTVGGHVLHHAPPTETAKSAISVAEPLPAIDPMAELRSRNRELGDTVQTLQRRLDQMQATLGARAAVETQVRGLQATIDGLKANLGTARSEQTAAVARLDGKIDKLGHEPGSRIQQLVDRLGRLEQAKVDATPTATLPTPEPKAAATHALPRPAEPRIESKTDARSVEPRSNAEVEPAKPPVLASWVVRGVYGGVALIEGRRGTLEVVPGVGIPGAGVVKSIDRHGNGWTVTTTKGLVAYAAPTRDYRRADRAAYGYGAPGYGYDF